MLLIQANVNQQNHLDSFSCYPNCRRSQTILINTTLKQ